LTLSRLAKIAQTIFALAAIVEVLRFLIDYSHVITPNFAPPDILGPVVAAITNVVSILTEPRLSIAQVIIGGLILLYIVNRILNATEEGPRYYNVAFKDAKEAKELAYNFHPAQWVGPSLIISQLEQKYGPGYVDLDIKIMQTVLLQGKNTAREIAIFLNQPIYEVLNRLRFLQQKGIILLNEIVN